MSKRLRTLIFLLFFLAFLPAAPLVVLYTAGYRYHFGTGQIVQTGIISLSSIPKGAQISIDGGRLRSVTPSVVKNVLPGNHDVRVEREGYSTWEKTLEVQSKETTFADDILLFMDEAPVLRRETSLRATAVNPINGIAAYVRSEGQWTEAWTYDPRGDAETLVSRLPLETGQRIRFAWTNGGEILSIRTGDGTTETRTDVDLETGTPTDASAPSDIQLSTLADRVAVSRKRGETNEILAYIPSGTYEMRDAPSQTLLFEDHARQRIVLVDAVGGDQPILLNAAATAWQWEPGGTRLLYTDGFEVHVYDVSTHADETITRLSSPIKDIGWFPGHSYVLYAQQDAIYAMELDRRDRRNVTTLVTGTDLGAFSVDPGGRMLYFFGTVDGKTGLFAKRVER